MTVRARRANRANIAFNPMVLRMTMLPHPASCPNRARQPCGCSAARLLDLRLGGGLLPGAQAQAQDDQLNKVHVEPPAATAAPRHRSPRELKRLPTPAPASLKIHPGSFIRMNVDMVLVPVTVTDPMNRLVTGLEKEDFQVYENNGEQKIASFASEDAPVSIGIIFDLSGSMTSKLIRARESILQFIKTANPQDEFFVIGFNDRPELIEDFTSSVEDIQARLATVRSGHRTALLDAIYYGVAKMKDAHHERKALLVVSDGGDNRSRYTEGEVRAQVREADVEIYSIGIFDPYAPTPEERTGPQLLDDMSEETGGRLFRVDDYRRNGRHCREDFHRAAQPICDRLQAQGPDPRRQVA